MTMDIIKNTQKNREALKHQGITLLTSTGDANLEAAELHRVIVHNMPQAGTSYVVPVERRQFRGVSGQTTSFRFATDEEIYMVAGAATKCGKSDTPEL